MIAANRFFGEGTAARRAARWARQRIVPAGMILMYHRIADEPLDPWHLCVSPENFARQLEVLRSSGVTMVSVSELAASLARGTLPRRTVAITFDDGYLDNLEAGHPILERYDAPATLFVTSGYVGSAGEFWWDVLERIFLAPGELPEGLDLVLNGDHWRWQLCDEAVWTEEQCDAHRGWKPHLGPETIRQGLYTRIRNYLILASAAERARVTAQLLQWAGLPEAARPSHRILDTAGLQRIAADGLVEVGGHSVSHPDLRGLGAREQVQELHGSKAALERMLGRPLQGMAYPHGGYTEETCGIAREAGYAYACGTVTAPVRRNSDPFCLPRFGIRNISGPEFRAKLSRYLPI